MWAVGCVLYEMLTLEKVFEASVSRWFSILKFLIIQKTIDIWRQLTWLLCSLPASLLCVITLSCLVKIIRPAHVVSHFRVPYVTFTVYFHVVMKRIKKKKKKKEKEKWNFPLIQGDEKSLLRNAPG